MATFGITQPRYGFGQRRRSRAALAGRLARPDGLPVDSDPTGRYALPDFDPRSAPKIDTTVPKVENTGGDDRRQTPRPEASLSEEQRALQEIESDPMLQRVRALALGRRGDAKTAATSRRQDVVTQFGFPELADELGFGEEIATVARENPLSVLAGIRREGEKARVEVDEGFNKKNLWFGGHRGLGLGELAQQVLGQEARARAQAQDLLNEISGNLLGVEQSATDFELDAEAEAFGRILDRIRRQPPPVASGTDDAGGSQQQPGPIGPISPPPGDLTGSLLEGIFDLRPPTMIGPVRPGQEPAVVGTPTLADLPDITPFPGTNVVEQTIGPTQGGRTLSMVQAPAAAEASPLVAELLGMPDQDAVRRAQQLRRLLAY